MRLNGGHASTPKKAAAARANARKPRGRWAGTAERAAIDEAKELLRMALPDGARRLVKILTDPKTPDEIFLSAMKIAADRAGLPVMTQTEVVNDRPLAPVLVRIEGGLGWPKQEANGVAQPLAS